LVLLLIIVSISALATIFASAEENYNIPQWVKNNAKWWAEGQVSDSDFVAAMKYLIENKIMQISAQSSVDQEFSEEYKEWAQGEISKYRDYSERLRNDLEASQKENQRMTQKYNDLYSKYTAVVGSKEQIEREFEQEKSYFEKEIETQKKSQIETLAETNPLIKGIISGRINYYIESLPSYAAPGVQDGVDWVGKSFESSRTSSLDFIRVYDPNRADLVIQWVKDYGSHTVGQAIFKSHVKVGLGQTSTCYGEWAPFDSQTVTKILWHEIGHSLGFAHSNDPNNIMYFSTDTRFATDLEKRITLDEGYYKVFELCRGGSYWYSVKSNDASHGFYFYVVTPTTNPREFINEDKGTYYSGCIAEDYASYSGNCNVAEDAHLIIYNYNELLKTSALILDVKIVEQNERLWPDMTWDIDSLQYSEELIEYIGELYS